MTNNFFPEDGLGPTAYSFDSVASNSMKSSNPNSGCRKVDLCKTLDTAALNPSANQGGIAVVYEVKPELTALPIQDGRAMVKKQNGLGLGAAGDPSYTLDSVGGQSVATWWDGGQISQTLDAVLAKGQTMPDKNRFPAVIQESRVRRLTPRECERLQGFPDDWTDCGSNSSRYKQMGNAVTVNVIAWIGSRLP